MYQSSNDTLTIPTGCNIVFEPDAAHFLCKFPYSKPFFDDFKGYIVSRYNQKWWRCDTEDFDMVVSIMQEHFS